MARRVLITNGAVPYQEQQTAMVPQTRTKASNVTHLTATSHLAKQVEKRTTPYTVKEIAELLAHDPEWVYQAIRRGDLRAMRRGPGGSIRVEPREFGNFIRRLQGLQELEAA